MINNNMIISGIVLSTLILIIACYFSISLFVKISQLKKFKKQKVAVYESKKSFNLIFLTYLSIVIFYIVEIPMIVLYFKDGKKEVYGIVFEIMFMMVVIFTCLYFLVANIYANSIIIVIKNNNLVTTNDIVKQVNWIRSSTNDKRTRVYVDYRDEKIKGNTKMVKFKYSWKLKDFLTDNGYYKNEVKK